MVAPLRRARPRPGRRAHRRRLAWRRLAGLCAGAALLAAVSAWLLTSPRLGVSRVEVVGANTVPNSLIVWQAAIPDGANIIRLRCGRVARRVAALPAIRSASVSRRPPHTVVIRVVEREPLLRVPGPAGPLYLDRDGISFQRCGDESPAVEVVGIPGSQLVPGVRVAGRWLPAVLGTCLAAQRRGLALRRVVVGPQGEIDLLLSGGATLRLGEPTHLTEKLEKAQLALQALKDRGPIEYVDVSCPDAVVWKPAQPPSADETQARVPAVRLP